MTHLILELILWILLAFFVGCIIGCLLRKLFGGTTAVEAPVSKMAEIPATHAAIESPAASAAIETPVPVITRKPEPKTAPAETMEEPLPLVAKPARPRDRAAAKAEPLPLAGKPARPRGIAGARSGKADNLQRISGVGPKNERTLHRLGFFHFDQIAAWTADEISWVDDHLKFNGRILRESWTKQAKLLADGKEEEFRKLYGTGGLRNKKGETESGTRTRKS